MTYIDVGVGEDFKISLESNPTTGYSWTADFNESILKLKEEKDYANSKPRLVGAGGRKLFTFEALLPRDTKVTMSYQRPWESESILEESFLIRIAEANLTHINATVGENFQISLEDNSGSTGYAWNANFDNDTLDLVKDTYEPYLPDIALPGMGGRRIFDFVSKKPGETDIIMMLKAPDEVVAKEWIFKINII
jgi:inhibitor of cysteine peptidase